MRRREFITLLAGTAATRPLGARAQQSAIPTIGFLSFRSANESAGVEAAFREGLSDIGYSDGRSVHIAFRWAEGQKDRRPAAGKSAFTHHHVYDRDHDLRILTARRRFKGAVLWLCRLTLLFGFVQGHGGANESLQRRFVYFRALVKVDSASCVAFKAGVEEARRILQSRTFGEGHLDDVLVSLAGADRSVV